MIGITKLHNDSYIIFDYTIDLIKYSPGGEYSIKTL